MKIVISEYVNCNASDQQKNELTFNYQVLLIFNLILNPLFNFSSFILIASSE